MIYLNLVQPFYYLKTFKSVTYSTYNVFVLIIEEIYDLEDKENINWKEHLFWSTDIDTVYVQILKA